MRYNLIIDGIECSSSAVKNGVLFYKDTNKGFIILKKGKKRSRKIGYVNTFEQLYNRANNELPHRNRLYLNP